MVGRMNGLRTHLSTSSIICNPEIHLFATIYYLPCCWLKNCPDFESFSPGYVTLNFFYISTFVSERKSALPFHFRGIFGIQNSANVVVFKFAITRETNLEKNSLNYNFTPLFTPRFTHHIEDYLGNCINLRTNISFMYVIFTGAL